MGGALSLSCCNDQQYLSIFLIVLYASLILLLWRLSIVHPFKILTVFLHELSHAIACWLTCGKVEGMEVHPNEGGATQTSGGIPWIILSAGYLGSAIWGMALIIASGNKLSSEIATGVLMFFLAIFMLFGNNSYLRILNAGFLIVLTGFMIINIWSSLEPLRYMTLFMGVMSCLFSIYDIWDDLLTHRLHESDATVLARLTRTSSRCWGIIWGIIAFITLIAAVYLHLVVEKGDGPSLSSIFKTSWPTQLIFFITVAVLLISVIHAAVTRRFMLQKRNFSDPGSRERDDNSSYVCITDAVPPPVPGTTSTPSEATHEEAPYEAPRGAPYEAPHEPSKEPPQEELTETPYTTPDVATIKPDEPQPRSSTPPPTRTSAAA